MTQKPPKTVKIWEIPGSSLAPTCSASVRGKWLSNGCLEIETQGRITLDLDGVYQLMRELDGRRLRPKPEYETLRVKPFAPIS